MPDQSAFGLPDELAAIFDDLIAEFELWYEGKRNRKGGINTNVMCAGLYVTGHLATACPLTFNDYRTDTQVKGAGGPQARDILARHGEHRPFTAEAGRTTRKTVFFAEELVEIINSRASVNGATELSTEDREILSHRLQFWFVRKIQEEYFAKQRIPADIDPGKPIRAAVVALLEEGRKRGGTAAGAIAQHLVGAKLHLRFPDVQVNNESYTTADTQTARAGDFQVGDAAFHVTMSPSEALFSGRCRHNLSHGFRPRVLVPQDKLSAASQLAELAGVSDRVAIQSVEDFVGTNIEEIAQFKNSAIRSGLRALLETYNTRIWEAEADKSLMIEIPSNL